MARRLRRPRMSDHINTRRPTATAALRHRAPSGPSTSPTTTAPPRTPRSCHARTSPRPAASSATTGQPRPRPARCRQPARVQHVPQRAFREWEQTQPELVYHAARAHNRGMIDFCSVDRRLLPTLYVPLADFDASAAMAREAIEMGAAALLVPSACPKGHSPSHLGLDPVWAAAQDAGIPVVFHVGGEGDHFNHDYFLNGLPIPADFHGGEENHAIDCMGIPHSVMLTMATMIFDGVLDRFPRLRLGAIELGAVWIPSWIHQMESAFEAFARTTRSACGPGAPPDRVRAAPDPGSDPVPDRRRRVAHPTTRPRHLPVLVGLPPHQRAGGSRSSGSSAHWAMSATPYASASTTTTSST